MRVQIKTKLKSKDRDIRAMLVLNKGIEMSTPRMVEPNVRFVLERLGWAVSLKKLHDP